jgi:hypothetical protein
MRPFSTILSNYRISLSVFASFCHVSIFHVTLPTRSKSFSVKSRHVPSCSVISFRSTSFILPSPSSVNSVHFRHSLVFMSLLCSELCSFRFMFRISSAPPYSDLWPSSLLIFPIILLFNNYPYCSLWIYDFIY